jgi:hypothetical protein
LSLLDGAHKILDDQLVRVDETVLLALEVRVKSSGRNPGKADQASDRHRVEPSVGDLIDHRGIQSLPLVSTNHGRALTWPRTQLSELSRNPFRHDFVLGTS